MVENIKMCQSCGMPLKSDATRGTESDGSASAMYCMHCYQNGKFTFEGSLDEFRANTIRLIKEQMKVPVWLGKFLTKNMYKLYRWSGKIYR